MQKSVSLFTIAAAIVIGVWWWLGQAVAMPPAPLARGEKLYCVSYAPFRGRQTPLDLKTRIEPWQIDQDLAKLAQLTDCVRTYSVDFGLDQVPEIARRHGLKVLLGLWVSSHADRTQWQLDTGVALAEKHRDVIWGVIVGNEALLRGEIAPQALADLIRGVKSQVKVPVSYADVWEFWLRNRALSNVVDFVTIHILPYWEDDPVSARHAADHVDSIRKKVAAELAGKEVVIGEVGWPSAGRMREAALPSPASQALVLHDVLARGRREGFRVNLIEAFDQPWKRYLEGTVGGHWGLLDDASRAPKFVWGEPVSNHPHWRLQATGGVLLVALVFMAATIGQRRRAKSYEPGRATWIAVALVAAFAGVLSGWAVENALVESLGLGGWLRSLVLVGVALAAPVAAGAALAAGVPAPAFSRLIGARADRVRDALPLMLGLILILLCVLAMEAALALAFDPRYRDFPFAPLTSAAVPFLLLSLMRSRPPGPRAIAEAAAAAVLALCAVVVVWNETLANWQALWFAGALIAVAITLVRARAAPG
jgi:glucan 1,3-beta-glucosidase